MVTNSVMSDPSQSLAWFFEPIGPRSSYECSSICSKKGCAISTPEFTTTGSAPDSINSLPEGSAIKIPVKDS